MSVSLLLKGAGIAVVFFGSIGMIRNKKFFQNDVTPVETNSNKEHHSTQGFVNPWKSFQQRSGKDLLKWLLLESKMFRNFWAGKEQGVPFPIVKPDWNAIYNPPKNGVQVTWIGHASFLVQMESMNILTDPIFSERCSPVQWIGIKRFVPAPFEIRQLPPIDIAVISHNHYDHLDVGSVKSLIPCVKKWFVPLGIKNWMVDTGVPSNQIYEMDWWESIKDSDKASVICTPSQHFSGRTLVDRNNSLWASWAIVGKKYRFYFAGDTGYKSVPKNYLEEKSSELPTCPAFKQIGEKFGPFDVAAIPIGAYSPRWFMSPVHLNPEDAVNVHLDVKSRQSIGMHWGTFRLTDEPADEPPRLLENELQAKKLPLNSFLVLKHGETRHFECDEKKE